MFSIRYGICLAIAFCLVALRASAQEAPVNVLLIYTDEQRIDALGAMGNADIDTPHIDALAADGVLYRNSFCTWPVCTPSRLSILSGQYVHQHGGRSNRSTLRPGTPTFASILREAGYATTAVGKMHLTPAYQDVGFDTMILAEQNGGGRNIDDYHRYLKDRGLINAIDLIDQERPFRQRASDEYWETFGAKRSDLPDEHHITSWVGDRAIENIAGWEADAGNLLMVGFLKPHHPFDPPAPWDERYDPEDIAVLPGWTEAVPTHDSVRARGYFDNASLTQEDLRRVTAFYYATITHLDHHVGRMVAELKRRSLYDNTLIVYTSDHGEYLGFHHMILKGNHTYDPLAKVPLVIKYPKQRHAGAVSDDLVNALDVTATILQETGRQSAPSMRGSSLGGGQPGLDDPRGVIVTQDRRSLMIRSHTTKLIADQDPARSLFFDLQADPLEMDNRIFDPAYAAEIARLRAVGLDWFLAETYQPVYVDESVPLTPSPNVPDDLERAEREMREYFEKMLAPLLEDE